MSEHTNAAGAPYPDISTPRLPRRSRRRSPGSGLFLFTGLLLGGAGVALEAAPHYSWRVVKVSQQVAALGVETGYLVVLGVVIFALGMFARALARMADDHADRHENSSVTLVVEQVAMDLADMKGTLRELAHRTVAVAEEQKVLLRNQLALLDNLETQAPDGSETYQNNNAIFRLAASMDQMGARMEQRIKHLDAELRDRMGATNAAMAQANTLLSQAQIAPTPAPAPAPLPTRGAAAHDPAPRPAAYPGHEELQVTVDLETETGSLPMQPSDEFFETVQQLESAVEAAMTKQQMDEAAATLDLAQAAPDALDALLPDDE